MVFVAGLYSEREENSFMLDSNNPLKLTYATIDNIIGARNKVEYILSPNNIALIRNHFESIGIKSYYDFYYFPVKEFRQIMRENENIKLFFETIVGKENLRYKRGNSKCGGIHKYNLKTIPLFAERIGFERLNSSDLKKHILSEFKAVGIESLNELSALQAKEFRQYFGENSYIRYFYEANLTDRYKYKKLRREDIFTLGEELGLKMLKGEELKARLVEALKDNKIVYLEDLDQLKIPEFEAIVANNLLLRYYFLEHKKYALSRIYWPEINDFSDYIGLQQKPKDRSQQVRDFLTSYPNYSSISSLDDIEQRSVLWKNPLCKSILKGFGVTSMDKFRLGHVDRVCRIIGVPGTPRKFEYDKIKTIRVIKNRLAQNGVESKESLISKGEHHFIRTFRRNQMPKELYQGVSIFIRNIISGPISSLRPENMPIIGDVLWPS